MFKIPGLLDSDSGHPAGVINGIVIKKDKNKYSCILSSLWWFSPPFFPTLFFSTKRMKKTKCTAFPSNYVQCYPWQPSWKSDSEVVYV